VDLFAEIIGRKISRINIITLQVRLAARSTARLYAAIVPSRSIFTDLQCTITGVSHEFDLLASLTPVLLAPHQVTMSRKEIVVDLENPNNIKEILLSLRSQVSTYVYEEINEVVYETDRGTWALDLRDAQSQDSFYDLSEANRHITLNDVSEFYSLDEAIRNAIVVLCERRQASIAAAITAKGGVQQLRAAIGVVAIDMFSDVSGSLFTVTNAPEITASINPGPGSSALKRLFAAITPQREEHTDLPCEISGSYVSALEASITGI